MQRILSWYHLFIINAPKCRHISHSITNNLVVKEKKLKLQKVALLMGYNGHDYHGYQRNPNVKTIEEEFLDALLKSNLISKEEHYTPKDSLSFQRTSRTDKGVSAIHQIVSLRLPQVDNLVERINGCLPPNIRIFGYKKVIKHFNCYLYATSRTYTYLIPTYAFCPIHKITSENFRTTDLLTEKINKLLQRFVGVHPFHNFTFGRTAEDDSSKRQIFNTKCSQPFYLENLEFYLITIQGQSFMLHQIRKIIALVIAIVRDLISEEIIDKAFEPPRRDFPMAPGLGLILEKVTHDFYNRKYGGRGKMEPLLWDDCKEEMARFKYEYLYKHIATTERKEKLMMKWLPSLLHYTYDIRHPDIPQNVATVRSILGKVAYCLKDLEKELQQELQ